MRAETELAARYLVGLRRRTHVATVTAISLVGLALGVMALILTLALLEGFQSTIRRELVARSAHARVVPARGRALTGAAALARRLQERLPGVEVAEVVRGVVMAGSGAASVPARVAGRSDAREVTVDRILAARLGIGVGDRLDLLGARRRLTPLGPVPTRAVVRVERVGPPEPGVSEGEVTVPVAVAQRLLWGRPVVEALELADRSDPWGLARRVRRALEGVSGVRVEGLEVLHRPLLLALSLERAMLFVAVGLMLGVAALNLLCNVAMVAAEKRRDTAVLQGLGLPPERVRGLFLRLGVGIGLAGTALGAVLGVALAEALDATGALPLPRGVFAVSSVPFSVRPAAVAVVVTAALAVSVAASVPAARAVARWEPAEGLRYE